MPVYLIIMPPVGYARDNIYYVKFGDTAAGTGERIATYNPINNRETLQHPDPAPTLDLHRKGATIRANVFERAPNTWIGRKECQNIQPPQQPPRFTPAQSPQGNPTEFFLVSPRNIQSLVSLRDNFSKLPLTNEANFRGQAGVPGGYLDHNVKTSLEWIAACLPSTDIV
ncbi:hypothetical protein B0H13DRAFT_1864132 [Mycena leptocephala]|nr:hypothetical protein B0H13DRAFT_1864132 [Mycena leptocephala]